jgi:hypothetical protein
MNVPRPGRHRPSVGQVLAKAFAMLLVVGSLYFFWYAGRFLIEAGWDTLESDNPRDAEDDVIPSIVLVTGIFASPGIALVWAARWIWSESGWGGRA